MKAPRQSDARKTRGRPFEKGNRAGRGRPKGSKITRTLVGEAMFRALVEGDGKKLPPFEERWRRLLTDPDATVRLAAEKYVADRLLGRPRQAVELGSPEPDREICVELRFSEGKPFTSRAASPARSPSPGDEPPRDFHPDDSRSEPP